ncbi:hypothetical protein B484DRAFT_457044 [Ochromonadaceae sp. CCMP2298]|nr:hypothetical protein B484DRAFT_457044 [Ochromonadaceae sp. CCMP2298]|mmetsp:Transcript_31290/g.67344  ORF Transcript_31290/g.67344 Transcript_31290/m.67344 type:complete len:411 (-) Transcript_31290:93-1325(-)
MMRAAMVVPRRLVRANQPALTARLQSTVVRTDWTREEIQQIYDLPFMDLVYKAASVHRECFNPLEVQQCTLISIKTGGCVEDCKYCSQSSRYKTFVKPTPTLKLAEVVESAKRAKASGSTRFCMGAAWRDVGDKKDRKAFAGVLEMVRQVRDMDMEVCCTLGMLTPDQARQLKEAGLTAYNHNLDTSREFYPSVITTRSFDDRLQTVQNVREAGISVCCGGILGLGEKASDRVGLLYTLATLPEHPESVPINALVPVEGTPLGPMGTPQPGDAPPIKSKGVDNEPLKGEVPTALEMARVIATARCVMPRTMVRLSAGRMSYSEAEQSLMFLAGANSIFYGEQLLTTPNPEADRDRAMFARLGLQGKRPFTAPLPPPGIGSTEPLILHTAGASAMPVINITRVLNNNSVNV